jgi:hypothetical protein
MENIFWRSQCNGGKIVALLGCEREIACVDHSVCDDNANIPAIVAEISNHFTIDIHTFSEDPLKLLGK